ncbi:MAG TPA: LutB/LldF family L-lactate oxidation iron-sulfur protein [Actinomycetota bacterium]|nr:LutB/LldF family L-lactate oxidation iron-sulfur protein [Actinomycetota bacterium]
MTDPDGTTFRSRADALLAEPAIGAAIGRAMDVRATARARVFRDADLEAMRAAGEAIRQHTIAGLAGYLDRFARNAEARGTRVFFASDASEAVGYVREVIRRAGARSIVKSKSMVSEEIGLNAALASDGAEVVETDLGEYIVQLAHQPPAHITVPAVHMTRTQIRDLFGREHGVSLSDEPGELTAFARQVLRERFLAADVGITGVNFAVADTGSLVIVTNEGNARMCTSLPRIHIALLGMERLVPSFRELSVLLPLLTGSATGQRITAYVNVIAGPRLPREADGPEEVHVVVLDNGRSAILGTEYRSILHCIRCGACQNACPVFRQVGGHAYGTTYGGPIGAVLEPLLEGFDRAGDLPHASSLCLACTDVCPVNIPLHEHLISLRRDAVAIQASVLERLVFALWGRLWSRPRWYRMSARLARGAQRPFTRGGRIGRAPFPLSRWTSGRDLPPLAGRSFQDRWARDRRRGT